MATITLSVVETVESRIPVELTADLMGEAARAGYPHNADGVVAYLTDDPDHQAITEHCGTARVFHSVSDRYVEGVVGAGG